MICTIYDGYDSCIFLQIRASPTATRFSEYSAWTTRDRSRRRLKSVKVRVLQGHEINIIIFVRHVGVINDVATVSRVQRVFCAVKPRDTITMICLMGEVPGFAAARV